MGYLTYLPRVYIGVVTYNPLILTFDPNLQINIQVDASGFERSLKLRPVFPGP